MIGAAGNRPRLVEPSLELRAPYRLPFFNTQMGKGAVTGGSNLYMGTAALSERDYVHRAIDRADLIVSIGHDTVEKPPFIMGDGGPRVIHIGFTSANVEQVFFPHAEVVGDIGSSLSLLADRLDGRLDPRPRIPGSPARDPRPHQRSRRGGPLPDDAAADRRTTCDRSFPTTGSCASTTACTRSGLPRNYRTHVANTLLLDNALATMGAGLPSAMMAALLYPERRVLAVCGDGGFMMNSQELETAMRLKLNLVVLILVDSAYGMIRWKQAVDRFPDWGLTFGNPDFVRYAEAYGAKGWRIGATSELVPTLEAAFSHGGVHLVAAPIDYGENTRVLVEELRGQVPDIEPG